MKDSLLQSAARIALMTFSLSHVAPLAWAHESTSASAASQSEMSIAVEAYNKAIPVYEKKGLQAFLDAFPKDLLTQTEKRFIVSEARGTLPLPEVKLLSPNKVLISLHRGTEKREVTVEAKDLDHQIFLINDHEFVASNDIEENSKNITQLLGDAGKVSWNPIELFIPTAEAHGAAAALTLGIVATVTAGVTAICLAAHAMKDKGGGRKHHHSSKSEGATNVPASEVGNSTVQSHSESLAPLSP